MKIIDLPYQANSEALFLKLCQLPHCVWLDSGKPGSIGGRYDIISALPSQVLTADDDNLVPQLESKLAAHANTSELPFSGGWIGQLNYDYQHTTFGLRRSKGYGAWFGWYDWAIITDHEQMNTSVLMLSTCDARTIEGVMTALSRDEMASTEFTCSTFTANESKEHYLTAIARIQEYLRAGDCYQVNYTQRFSAHFSGSAAGAYRRMRNTVPSPFCAYLDLGDTAILSVSPERFIQVQGQQALAQPIKGTIRRGENDDEDACLTEQLLQSTKNRAENVMIVDLLRNDFGRLCVAGSIKVPRLFEVQTFANVHHLVSTIRGTLPVNVSHSEFIFSCFPGGSITGAPKKRAMHIIDELEHHSRNAYCGSIGYFSANSNSDFNIAIRTMERKGDYIYAWAGGGIVIDSDPESEYEECFTKISHLMKALEQNV